MDFNNGTRENIIMFPTAYFFILWFLNPMSCNFINSASGCFSAYTY